MALLADLLVLELGEEEANDLIVDHFEEVHELELFLVDLLLLQVEVVALEVDERVFFVLADLLDIGWRDF